MIRRTIPFVIALACIGACSGDEDDEVIAGLGDSGTPTEDASGGVDAPPVSPDAGETKDSSTSDASLDADADAKPPYKHYDINHVLSTGQSDSVANGASPPLTTTQPFGNLSFTNGVMSVQSCDGDGCTQYETPTSFIPLVEGDEFFNYGVETMSSGFANQATVFATAYFAKVGLPAVQHDILVSLHGRSGNTYWCLRKNPCSYYDGRGYVRPFAEGMAQVTNAKALAAAQNKSYVVRAVTTIHGGSDHYDKEQQLANDVERNDGLGKVGNYAEALIEWQKDYESSIKAITNQTEAVPLFVSQFGSFTDVAVSRIPVRQMEAHVKALGKVIVVTPNYPFVHYSDCNHYDNYSQRRLGAYFAKAYHRTVVEGVPWEPLRPISVTRVNNVVTVKFLVPVPPLVLDTTRVTNPGNFGFTYVDSTSSATVQAVALAGADTVIVTLSATPTGADKKLRYALNAPVPTACPGPTDGARGNLRDSDSTGGYHKDRDNNPNALFNWAVHFEAVVP